MKILVLGLRGIPDVQGGVETHVQHLYPRIAALGCNVEVVVRTPFVPKDVHSVGSIVLRRIWSPRLKGVEAFVHSLLAILYAGVVRPDIVHIHAIGPAIVTPIARLLGLKVVVTHHGQDYERDKWGPIARAVLRAGERMGMKYANGRIVISSVIRNLVQSKYGLPATLIPNGVIPAACSSDMNHVAAYGLESHRYFLQVSRIVPEKRQLDLIRAYQALPMNGWKLVLVGGLDSDPYCNAVRAACSTSDIVLTGFLKGEALHQIYSHAGAFVLPSSHEGLPIAMLEALSYGLPVLASDIPANLELGLDPSSYFPLGNTSRLAECLMALTLSPQDDVARAARKQWVTARYDWDLIAERTYKLYEEIHSG